MGRRGEETGGYGTTRRRRVPLPPPPTPNPHARNQRRTALSPSVGTSQSPKAGDAHVTPLPRVILRRFVPCHAIRPDRIVVHRTVPWPGRATPHHPNARIIPLTRLPCAAPSGSTPDYSLLRGYRSPLPRATSRCRSSRTRARPSTHTARARRRGPTPSRRRSSRSRGS